VADLTYVSSWSGFVDVALVVTPRHQTGDEPDEGLVGRWPTAIVSLRDHQEVPDNQNRRVP
jgi:hypothetical protein